MPTQRKFTLDLIEAVGEMNQPETDELMETWIGGRASTARWLTAFVDY